MLAKRTHIQVGLMTVAALLAGCSGSAGSPGTASMSSFSPAVPSAVRAPRFMPAGSRSKNTLFVVDLNAAVTLFPANINQKNPSPIGQITQGVTRGVGVAIGRNGTLYVSSSGGKVTNVAEYKRGSSSPFFNIFKGLYVPGLLAVDSSGNLFVADSGPSLLVYPPGASSPSETIKVPFVGRTPAVAGLAFDAKGDLLIGTFEVEHQLSNVYSLPPGSTQPVNLNLQSLPGGAVGADKLGNIYVGGSGGYINVYAPGSTTPSRTINAGSAGFYSELTVAPNGTIYWPNYDSNEMFEFAPGASAPTNVFLGGGGVDAAVGRF